MTTFLFNKRRGRELYLPQSLRGKGDIRQYVRGLSHEAKRLVVLDTESEMKAIAGRSGFLFRIFGEEELSRLEDLINVRSFVLDEMLTQPTAEELKRLEYQNGRLLRLTHEVYEQVDNMAKMFNEATEIAGQEREDYFMEGSLKFEHYGDDPDVAPSVIRMENDKFYGSDFDYTLELIAWVTELGSYPEHFVEYPAGMHPFDDGETWADGYLMKDAYKHLCVCYALHSVCSHQPFSIPDVLRMDSFLVSASLNYHQYSPITDNNHYE